MPLTTISTGSAAQQGSARSARKRTKQTKTAAHVLIRTSRTLVAKQCDTISDDLRDVLLDHRRLYGGRLRRHDHHHSRPHQLPINSRIVLLQSKAELPIWSIMIFSSVCPPLYVCGVVTGRRYWTIFSSSRRFFAQATSS